MQHVLAATSAILSLKVLASMTIGTVAGIVFAAIPGFTITMAITLTLPFTFGMGPVQGLATMLGVYVGGYSGGLISGILLGIPGTPSSICTVYDGFPMAKKGEAGRALALGVMASTLGGLVGALVCVSVAVPVARFGLKFGPWEMFSLIFFALTLIASLGSRSLLKGLLSGAIGLFLATVGIDPIGGRTRFTFGIPDLTTGFEFLPVLIGFFAVPQMMSTVLEIQQAMADQKTEAQSFLGGSLHIPWLSALGETLRQWVNVLRSSLIGCVVGALPAAGGNTANFIAYDQAKRFSKNPDAFGTGAPEGIIASEAGNNGVAGGSLIPTVALGIPGNAITAVMLGALILHGITPGPLLFRQEPVLVYSIFVALIVAHFIMLAVHAVGMRFFIKVAQSPKYALVPVVLMLCVVGSFSLNNRVFDVTVFAIFGLVGYFMDILDIPSGPAVLGLILGPLAETNLRRALMTSADPTLFVTRPISLTLLALSALSLAFSLSQIRKQSRKTKAQAGA